eukprot:370339_1
MRKSIAFFSLSFLAFDAEAYAPGSSLKTNNVATTRSQFLQSVAAMAAGAVIAPSQSIAAVVEDKQFNLPPNVIGAIVEKDLVENAFLTNGKLTRSIYDEKATFTDEIDTYTLDKWIKGTARLFVGPPGSTEHGGSY